MKRKATGPGRYAAGWTLAHHDPKWRRCLGPCNTEFFSRGPGNRFCGACEAKKETLSRREG